MPDTLDIRDLADEWAGLVLDEDEIVADATFFTKPHPRFPRLHLAVVTHNALIDHEESVAQDVAPYIGLAEQLGCDTTPDALRDWANDFEPTLIADDYFKEYAQELADDIGAVDKDLGWPGSFIDWDAAADALRQDYTSVTYDGDDYLVRS